MGLIRPTPAGSIPVPWYSFGTLALVRLVEVHPSTGAFVHSGSHQQCPGEWGTVPVAIVTKEPTMSRISALVANANDLQHQIVPITAWGIELEVRGHGSHSTLRVHHETPDRRGESEDQDALNQLATPKSSWRVYLRPRRRHRGFHQCRHPNAHDQACGYRRHSLYDCPEVVRWPRQRSSRERLGKDFSAVHRQ